jgi:preprotein translocase subunit YajC
MSFLISDALAEAAPVAAQGQDPGFVGLLMPLAILGVFFFLFVWPQHKRGRDHKKLIESLTKGSEIVTNGGVLGRIVDIDPNFVHLEISDDVVVHVQKHAVASLMPKGTYKARKRAEK